MEIIEGTNVVKQWKTAIGVQTPIKYDSRSSFPLDFRLRIDIISDEPTLEDFQTIRNPYVHLLVHVHKVNSNGEEIDCLGIYEVDSLVEIIKLGIKSKVIEKYHRVYSTTIISERELELLRALGLIDSNLIYAVYEEDNVGTWKFGDKFPIILR